MPSFQDSAVLVILALLLFGPKKLPVLARQLGKLMADFRKASNEFRTQMEEELRISEQAERQKQVAAIEAAAPSTPAIAAAAESVPPEPSIASALESAPASKDTHEYPPEYPTQYPEDPLLEPMLEPALESAPSPAPEPTPIATSGELSILPPSTGLPVASTPSLAESNGNASNGNSAAAAHPAELETETIHG
jgi:sec-independent protein translocase protein TatB